MNAECEKPEETSAYAADGAGSWEKGITIMMTIETCEESNMRRGVRGPDQGGAEVLTRLLHVSVDEVVDLIASDRHDQYAVASINACAWMYVV